MQERPTSVTMKQNPLSLAGTPVNVGDTPQDCTLVTRDLTTVSISSFRPKICIISSVPSLDTAVCNVQTRTFNQCIAPLSDDFVVLTVSMDLPFAQKRFCTEADLEDANVLSDHRQAQFGQAYGVLIPDLRLLARAVFILDSQGTIRYLQIVPELTDEPDYDAAISAAKALLQPT